MTATLTVHDETAAGRRTGTCTLDFLTARITVRDLIRARVEEEVRERNQAGSAPPPVRRLIEPTAAERRLNGERRDREPAQRVVAAALDPEEQVANAVEAFRRGRFFILVDDRQVERLDDAIELRPATEVSFVRLVPLVGG